MNGAQTLLLLDLDGVVVFEAEPPHIESAEILLLHELLAEGLKEIGAPVVVVTHRSRAEAERILQAARLNSDVLSGIVAAEDLFSAGLKHHGVFLLARKGLRKSLILPVMEKKFGIDRSHMALIDDRLDNLEDMLANGIGLTLLAPSLMKEGGSLVSFDVSEAVAAFKEWGGAERKEAVYRLTAQKITIDPWRKTGLNTRKQGRHIFNAMRRMGRATRTLIFEKRT